MGGRAWQERRPPQWTLRILLEFILITNDLVLSLKMVDLSSSFSPPKSTKPILSQPIDGAAASRDYAAPPPENPTKDLEPVKIAVLLGRQELKLKIKQNEEVAGPKVRVLDCFTGKKYSI